jgi:hypothetical protein
MLDVLAANGRSKLHEDDFARFYPREHTADQILRRLRSMVRSGNRQAAASRRERARQRRQAAAGATTATLTPTSTPTSTEDPPIIARTAGDTEERESPFPTPETYKRLESLHPRYSPPPRMMGPCTNSKWPSISNTFAFHNQLRHPLLPSPTAAVLTPRCRVAATTWWQASVPLLDLQVL